MKETDCSNIPMYGKIKFYKLITMAKNILINANTICLPRWGGEGYISGVGRSTSYLLDALNRINDKDLYISLLVEGPQYIGTYPDYENLNINYVPFFSRLGIGKLLRKYLYRPDVYHFPDNFNIHEYKGEQYILTIHDMIQYKTALLNHDTTKIKKYESKVRNAELIFTCSEFSKKEILKYIEIPEKQIEVVYWGIDNHKFKKLDSEVDTETQRKIGGRYFLSVSCKDERKNIRILLKAYEKFQQTSKNKLVLIWSNPPQDILIAYSQLIEEKKLIILNYVSDIELVKLYNAAIATLFPSREEGFGFPILESFACGTPVMTCKNSSLTEIGGSLANFVGEDSLDEMIDTMRYLSNIDKSEFIPKASAYIKKFSWDNTAQHYIDVYKKL